MKWLKAAGIRAIKTFAQTMLAGIGTTSVCISQVNWLLVLSTSTVAALLSLLTSLAGLPEAKSVLDLDDDEEEKDESV